MGIALLVDMWIYTCYTRTFLDIWSPCDPPRYGDAFSLWEKSTSRCARLRRTIMTSACCCWSCFCCSLYSTRSSGATQPTVQNIIYIIYINIEYFYRIPASQRKTPHEKPADLGCLTLVRSLVGRFWATLHAYDNLCTIRVSRSRIPLKSRLT